MTIPARQLAVVFVSLIAAAALLAFTGAAWSEPPGDLVDEGPGGAEYAAGELIVTYEDQEHEQEVESLGEEAGATVAEDLPDADAKVLEFPEVKSERSQEVRERDLERIKEKLEKSPGVESVYYNYVRTGMYTPNDPRFRYQYGLRKPGFEKAWSRTRGRGTRVAVIDSGAAIQHPDLQGRVVAQYDFVNNNSTVEDLHGHGTHTAGTVAARTGNGIGVAGGCPGCRLIIGKALNRDLVGNDSDIANAITWSVDHGAKVVNLSLGGPGEKSILKGAIDYATRKGANVVAAAGNGGTGPIYPAAYANVIAVAATGPNDGRDSSFSTGSYIDVAAPGINILSTVPGGYEYRSGTSMSSPHVAALAGLLRGQGRGPLATRYRILRTAVDLGPRGKDPYYGYGRINADRATRR
ncbi:MAG TPA: S8 family peptidase [Rubrobacteraceae bacterium]|nr:S8 family peptidase [Rubrobacteraceae bacterium]